MDKFIIWLNNKKLQDDKDLSISCTKRDMPKIQYYDKLDIGYSFSVSMTKQMLIGYMIDYVGENDPLGSFTNAEAFYDYLETLIEEINNG